MSDKTQIVRAADDPPTVALLQQYEGDLAEALPDGMTAGRFKSIVVNQLRANRQLLNAEPLSVVASCLMAAQLGLEPGPPLGLTWIIPRRERGRLMASCQIGYAGLRQLAYRSGAVKKVEARIVHDGDRFDYTHGTGGTNIVHVPTNEPGREWTHVYCIAETSQGAELVEVMSVGEVREHRDRYVSGWEKSQAWRENEPEMARKTVTARVCRQLPMSVEFRQALAADGQSPRELAPDLAGMLALGLDAEGAADDD